jgi:hypothetical protein
LSSQRYRGGRHDGKKAAGQSAERRGRLRQPPLLHRFIISGCIFIIFAQCAFFIMALWDIRSHDFIFFMSALDISIFEPDDIESLLICANAGPPANVTANRAAGIILPIFIAFSSDYTGAERSAREFVPVQSCFIVFKMRDFVQNCDTSTKEPERRADFGALF